MRQFFCSDSGASKCSAGLVVGWLGVLLIALGAVFAWVEFAYADDCYSPCSNCTDMHGKCRVVLCEHNPIACPSVGTWRNFVYCCQANGPQCSGETEYCDTQCNMCQQYLP